MDEKIELNKNLERKTPDQIVNWFLIEDAFGGKAIFAKNENMFFEWNGSFYQPVDEYNLLRTLWNHVNELKLRKLFPESQGISKTSIKNLYDTLTLAHPRVVEVTSTPFIGFNDGHCLNLTNFTFEESTMDIPIFFGLDFPSTVVIKPSPCPVFEEFLRTTLVTKGLYIPDEELISFIQEIFGYCLTNSIAAHVTFFFFGSGRNGKSVLLEILRAIVGEKYISNMSIQDLTTKHFAPANLVGKKLNIASEEESKFIKCDTFKSLVAGDPITVERKYRDPFEYRPNVKFLFATNQIPVFDSTDIAIRDRVFIIPFFKYFEESERDRNLVQKLKAELAGILAWALEGAKRIVNNGYSFTIPQCVHEMTEEFIREQSSVLTFIHENYMITGNHSDYVNKRQFHKRYCEWCLVVGKRSKGESSFFKDLINVFRGKINTDARMTFDGRQTRVVTGIRITDDTSAWVSQNPGSGC